MKPRLALLSYQLGQLVRQNTVSSIHSLERQTKMSEGAVRTHLKDLEAAGLVSRDDSHKEHLYALDPKCAYVVGVEVNRRRAMAAVCDMRLQPCGDVRMIQDPEFDLSDPPDEGMERIVALINQAIGSAKGCSPLIGVGISMPAPILGETSKPATTYHLPGWEDVGIGTRVKMELLRQSVELPVVVDNDASVGALACFLHEAYGSNGSKPPRDLIYVRTVEGIGAGVVLRGRLVAGGHGLAGEIGHFRVTKGGPLCPRCGSRGCLETMASTTAIEESLRSTGVWDESHTLEDMLGAPPHPAVNYALREAGGRIGLALSNASNLLNPDLIFLGGPLRGQEPFKEAIEAAVREYALEHSVPQVRWSPEMPLSPELSGAAARAAQTFFDDHLWKAIDKDSVTQPVTP